MPDLRRPPVPRRSAILAVVGILLASCATKPGPEAVRVNSHRLQSDRERLEGRTIAVPGYLVSTRTIGKAVCFKVLVDERLRFAPELLIENAGRASDPVPGLRETYQRVDPRKRTKTNRVHSKREVKIYIGSAPSTNSGLLESKGAMESPSGTLSSRAPTSAVSSRALNPRPQRTVPPSP